MSKLAAPRFMCAKCNRLYIAVHPRYRDGCLRCGGEIIPLADAVKAGDTNAAMLLADRVFELGGGTPGGPTA